MRNLAPGLVRQLMDALNQFVPLAAEVASGKQEFMPTPEESAALIRSYYGTPSLPQPAGRPLA